MANLETGQLVATATDAVRSEAPTGILSERDADKTASRQLATSLLGHLGTSPDDNNPRGTSVGDSFTQTPREPAGSSTRRLIDGLLDEAIAGNAKDATSRANPVVVNNQVAFNMKILQDLEATSVNAWVRSIETAVVGNLTFSLNALLSDSLKQSLGTVLQRDPVFRARFKPQDGSTEGFVETELFWSTAPPVEIARAMGRLFQANPTVIVGQSPVEAVSSVKFTLDPF